MTDHIIVTIQDMRELHYCARGVREFFARYNLDYSDFLQNGIEAEKILNACNNDAMIVAAVEVARGRE